MKFVYSGQTEWTQISSHHLPGNEFVILDLIPATWYHIRINAYNSAGSTEAEYKIATLTVYGAAVEPPNSETEL